MIIRKNDFGNFELLPFTCLQLTERPKTFLQHKKWPLRTTLIMIWALSQPENHGDLFEGWVLLKQNPSGFHNFSDCRKKGLLGINFWVSLTILLTGSHFQGPLGTFTNPSKLWGIIFLLFLSPQHMKRNVFTAVCECSLVSWPLAAYSKK